MAVRSLCFWRLSRLSSRRSTFAEKASPSAPRPSWDTSSFVLMLGALSMSLFAVNSVLVALYSSLKKNLQFWKVWTDNCFSAVIIYLTGAVVAGIVLEALESVNIFLIAAVVAFFGVIYLTFM